MLNVTNALLENSAYQIIDSRNYQNLKPIKDLYGINLTSEAEERTFYLFGQLLQQVNPETPILEPQKLAVRTALKNLSQTLTSESVTIDYGVFGRTINNGDNINTLLLSLVYPIKEKDFISDRKLISNLDAINSIIKYHEIYSMPINIAQLLKALNSTETHYLNNIILKPKIDITQFLNISDVNLQKIIINFLLNKSKVHQIIDLIGQKEQNLALEQLMINFLQENNNLITTCNIETPLNKLIQALCCFIYANNQENDSQVINSLFELTWGQYKDDDKPNILDSLDAILKTEISLIPYLLNPIIFNNLLRSKIDIFSKKYNNEQRLLICQLAQNDKLSILDGYKYPIENLVYIPFNIINTYYNIDNPKQFDNFYNRYHISQLLDGINIYKHKTINDVHQTLSLIFDYEQKKPNFINSILDKQTFASLNINAINILYQAYQSQVLSSFIQHIGYNFYAGENTDYTMHIMALKEGVYAEIKAISTITGENLLDNKYKEFSELIIYATKKKKLYCPPSDQNPITINSKKLLLNIYTPNELKHALLNGILSYEQVTNIIDEGDFSKIPEAFIAKYSAFRKPYTQIQTNQGDIANI